ncbi:TPA: hypothetical protein MDE14_005101 [Klebsiella pneumoniae]|uniref:hypothetical protein n=1 Tax=Klebsiella pneumoniae TaxID=573 RepID=UPI0023AFF0C7|nr:hypothetical protein [Klebsiella pneumoniae]MDE8392892.1 hypothetical protein [Klebsiella pneumoniae]HBU8764015.1 hypothetical protein [Klebsiella pneumoniae]
MKKAFFRHIIRGSLIFTGGLYALLIVVGEAADPIRIIAQALGAEMLPQSLSGLSLIHNPLNFLPVFLWRLITASVVAVAAHKIAFRLPL